MILGHVTNSRKYIENRRIVYDPCVHACPTRV